MTSAITEPTIIHNTFIIERSFPQSPDKVFAAFADAAKKQRWYAESSSHELMKFAMDFRVGGAESYAYKFGEGSPFPGLVITNEGTFQEIVEDRTIVLATTMTFGDKRISTSLVTVEILPKDSGCELILTHQGAFYPGADGPQMREAGWKKILDRLPNVL